MANMSYCRMENTMNDLQDCFDAIAEAGSVQAYFEDCSRSEKNALVGLIELCREMDDNYGEEVDELGPEHLGR